MSIREPAQSAAREELREVVRRFLERKAPVNKLIEFVESEPGYEPAVWQQMGQQLALQALVVPEEYGGQGFGFRELAVVLEEQGRQLYTGPYFSTVVLATQLLLLSGDIKACAKHLPEIAAGEQIVTAALFEPGRNWSLASADTTSHPDGEGNWRLSGCKAFVIDGAIADVILVTASCPDGVGLFSVDTTAAGLRREPVMTLDLTRRMATLRFDDVAAVRVGTGDARERLLPALMARAAVGLACEQVGGAQQAMSLSVEYASERIQFGRPIGSFQAVRHRCADMLVAVECARAAAHHAAACIDDGDPQLEVAAGIAKSYCSDAYVRVAADAIQVHGGIGFTWEHPAHLYLKRAKSSALLFGDSTLWRARISPVLLQEDIQPVSA